MQDRTRVSILYPHPQHRNRLVLVRSLRGGPGMEFTDEDLAAAVAAYEDGQYDLDEAVIRNIVQSGVLRGLPDMQPEGLAGTLIKVLRSPTKAAWFAVDAQGEPITDLLPSRDAAIDAMPAAGIQP